MKRPFLQELVRWGLAPLAILVAAAGLTHAARGARDAAFPGMAAAIAREQGVLQTLTETTLSNAAWALADVDAAKAAIKAELDQLPESEGRRRARLFLRFGLIDSNPDGQAAVFAQACVADPSVCDQLREAAEQETRARFVAPGNRLPLSLLGGHPPLDSP